MCDTHWPFALQHPSEHVLGPQATLTSGIASIVWSEAPSPASVSEWSVVASQPPSHEPWVKSVSPEMLAHPTVTPNNRAAKARKPRTSQDYAPLALLTRIIGLLRNPE